ASKMDPSSTTIPDVVKEFIQYFYKCYLEDNVYELHGCYENTFNKLTEKFYKNETWPDPIKEVAPLVNNDQVFLVLYSEVYYRHIYAKLNPTLQQRCDSYSNYCNLFNLILNNDGGPVTFELPNKWLWEIIDEFIYQFIQFTLYRTKLAYKFKMSEQDINELNYLQEHNEVWNAYSVLNALYSLIGRSKIKEQLQAQKKGFTQQQINEIAGEYGNLPLYKNLGYFSIIGLLRIHTVLGDFTLALKTMEDIELNKKAFLTRIPGCHFTTYYYVGCCYLMMHRYSDAIKIFSHILLFISRTKNINKSGQYDAITKRSEQMYALLTICIGLSPTRIDDILHQHIKQKFGEQLSQILKTNDFNKTVQVYEELFKFGFPRFISISFPNFTNPQLNTDALALHLKVFMIKVTNSVFNNLLRTYLSLYSTMELKKLLNFLVSDKDIKIDNLDQLRSILLSFKLNNRQVRWVDHESSSAQNNENLENTLLEGSISNVNDFDINLKNDNLISIIELKVARKFSDWFIRNTLKNYQVQDTIANADKLLEENSQTYQNNNTNSSFNSNSNKQQKNRKNKN
ncbi:uncharacterized protein ASCRUDRAFT_30425, partial [Ascoidea rubescens DSM 1968]